ncbi:hypothetical protein HanOQP8_Chr08g0283751 [Helianthus annuus]|nr:hypothetical protein HanOQP8_Chr08g0283751 [Helianthus annuus]
MNQSMMRSFVSIACRYNFFYTSFFELNCHICESTRQLLDLSFFPLLQNVSLGGMLVPLLRFQPWKKSSRTTNLLFMDPTNPQWGWSWLERYMAGRPWETEKNQSSAKNGINITGPEIAKSYARRQLNSTPKPQSQQRVVQ